MRKARLLLLTGTILPVMVLSGPSSARPGFEGAGEVQLAQGGPGGEGHAAAKAPGVVAKAVRVAVRLPAPNHDPSVVPRPSA